MSRAVYCKCLNTYSIKCKQNEIKGCDAPDYWKQGIGSIYKEQVDLLLQENGDYILQENNEKIIL
tara:strand:- start:129 stop:323 length:195 start_codon:yes stop_codon:yes gene_type:complete